MIKGRIHSLNSFATLEGGGIRYAIFLQGCPLRCKYCHNPDTQNFAGGTEMTAEEIVSKIKRNISFYKSGGVTISGGEPLMQANFIVELASLIREETGLEVAVDTSGGCYNNDVDRVVELVELFIVDIKFASDVEYLENTGVGMSNTMRLLDKLKEKGKRTILRSVIIPGINDNLEYIKKYADLAKGYDNVTEYELLGYHTLGVYKYEDMGIDYQLADTPPMDKNELKKLQSYLDSLLAL